MGIWPLKIEKFKCPGRGGGGGGGGCWGYKLIGALLESSLQLPLPLHPTFLVGHRSAWNAGWLESNLRSGSPFPSEKFEGDCHFFSLGGRGRGRGAWSQVNLNRSQAIWPLNLAYETQNMACDINSLKEGTFSSRATRWGGKRKRRDFV